MAIINNRLIHETSPYLLQHAHNPVEWFPWGAEPFALAQQSRKPVLLSIGYSACHWCHVMAHESFEDPDISEIMNEHFVNIKVDREERPDLDQIYQNAVQYFIKRAGGWPLTMFLTPEKLPFHGGTYFPPEDRYQLPGFKKLLLALSEAYQERPNDIRVVAKNVLNVLNREKKKTSQKTMASNLLQESVESLGRNFDVANGGFGGAPKFPSTPALTLFLHFYEACGIQHYLEMVRHSLKKMAFGGMYDQVAGGFHRYSVDEAWKVPHFEKMLYDNAQLARLYFSTYQLTKDVLFKEVGIEILDYVLREMTDAAGGFYSAQDADSEGGEGSFYTWSPQELTAILGKDTASIVCKFYQITERGNFEGKSIPHRQYTISALAKTLGKSEKVLREIIHAAKEKLLVEREKRPKPLRDEKIMTNWNGLMIGAFVSGYQVTGEKGYLSAAMRAADFILKDLYKDDRLLHTFKDGVGKLSAYLDDVAFFSDALLDLYEVGAGTKYLKIGQMFADQLITHYWDETEKGFFFTADDHEILIDKPRSCLDHSIPSGNAVAAKVLLRLYYLTGDKIYFEKGEETLLAFSSEMDQNPFATGSLIAVADFYLRRPKEIHIVGDMKSPEAEALLSNLRQIFLPNKVISFTRPGEDDQDFPHRDWLSRKGIDGKPTVYICQNFSCSQALTEWDDIKKTLLEP